MANLDQILLRLPRKTPDAGFVDRLFAQIRGKGRPPPAPSITHQNLFLPKPDCIESARLNKHEDEPIMPAESNFFPPPVMQRASSLDSSRFTEFSHRS